MTGGKYAASSPVTMPTDPLSQLHVPNKERRRSSGGSKTLATLAASWETRRDSLEKQIHHHHQHKGKNRSRYFIIRTETQKVFELKAHLVHNIQVIHV